MTIANVNLNNTFDDWRKTTNQLIVFAYQTSDRVNTVNSTIGSISKIYRTANGAYDTANASFEETNLVFTLSNSIYALTNASFNIANIASNTTNLGFLVANVGSNTANAAYGVTNTVYTLTNASFGVTNASFGRTNSVYDVTNTVYTLTNASFGVTNASFGRTNSVYDVTNTVYTVVNAAFNKANTGGGAASSVNVGGEINSSDTYYPTFTQTTTGLASVLNVASSKLTFIPSTGTLSSTQFNSLSDERLKDNITPISNALNTVNSMEGVSFTWKENGNKSYGLIAQQIEQLVPELVDTINDTKTVNYDSIIAFLIEAIKELNRKLEEKN